MLLIQMLWHNVRHRARRLRDEEAGAINTVELLVLIGLIVVLVTVAIGLLSTRVQQRAQTVPLS